MMTNDLSKRLRLRNIMAARTGKPEAPIFDEAADLIDQQAAEIVELSEIVEAQKNEILDLHDVRDQRDEWERRAQRLHDLWMSDADPREATEAAQWFEEN